MESECFWFNSNSSDKFSVTSIAYFAEAGKESSNSRTQLNVSISEDGCSVNQQNEVYILCYSFIRKSINYIIKEVVCYCYLCIRCECKFPIDLNRP